MSNRELNESRRKAVRLRLEGHTLKVVAEKTGLSHPTIIAAVKAFREGGWAQVDVHPGRGRPTRQQASLVPALHRQLLDAMREPDAPALWNRARVQQWLQTVGTKASRTAVDAWLRRMGWLTRPAPPPLPPDGTPRWTAGAWNPLDPHAGASGYHLHDPQGHDWWIAFAGQDPAEDDILHMLRALAAQSTRPALLCIPGAQALAALPAVADHLSHCNPPIALVEPETPAMSQVTAPQRTGTSSHPDRHTLTHLQRLEAESIHIMREVVAEADKPVMLYSIGKDSAVMLHLAMKAFYPARPPFPLLHVDTRWKFREMYRFRDRMAKELGMELLVHINPEGVEKNINPFTHGSAIHTDIMKTEGLKQALDQHGFDAAFGGARRDEEKSRAKERIFSFRTEQHRWDPKNQRPELWHLYNGRKHKGESMRVFPLSNWTELDIWQYIYLQNIPIVPLYYAAERPVVERDGVLIMVDDERMPLRPGEVPMLRKVRFRTLGCYPLTGAVLSEADTLPAIIQEMLLTTTSERQGRVIDHDSAGSMEKKKQEGYF